MYLYKKAALTRRYIEFGGGSQFHWISIDVDYTADMGIWMEYGLPPPTFTVKTDKGHHIHYRLTDPVYVYGHKKPLTYAKMAQQAIIWKINGDQAAKGLKRIWRNPLEHQHIFVDVSYQLHDFGKIITDYYSQNELQTSFAKYIFQAKQANDSKSEMKNGDGRNCHMFNELRLIAYRMYRDNPNLSFEELFEVAESLNEFAEKLSKKELSIIVKSIYRFLQSRYQPSSRESREKRTQYQREWYRRQSGSVVSGDPLSRKETLVLARSERSRKRASINQKKIDEAIVQIKSDGKKVTAVEVSSRTGLSRQTVAKYMKSA